MIKKWTLLTYNHILTIYLSLQRTAITRSFTEKDCFSIPEVWVWVNRVLLYHWESPLVTPVGYQVFFFSLRSFQTGDFNMLNFPKPCIKLSTWHHPFLPAIFPSCPRVFNPREKQMTRLVHETAFHLAWVLFCMLVWLFSSIIYMCTHT